MYTPSPLLSPNEFLAHAKSLGLDAVVTPFTHYQNRPLPSLLGGRYDEGAAQEWCERMYTLLVCPLLSQHPSIIYSLPGEVESRHALTSNACRYIHCHQRHMCQHNY